MKLLDDPRILDTAKMVLPIVSEEFKKWGEWNYFVFVYLTGQTSSILNELEPEKNASIKIIDYLQIILAQLESFTLEVKI